MSLLDFDDDGINAPMTTNVGFGGQTSSIDDPFGFDVFGTGSTTGSKAAAETSEVGFHVNANSDNFFDDFDPLTSFGDGSTKITSTSTTTSSARINPDQFDAFGDFSGNNHSGVTQTTAFQTTTNTRAWGEGGDDGAFTDLGHRSREGNLDFGEHNGDHNFDNKFQAAGKDEISGETKSENSIFGENALWTLDTSSVEQKTVTSSLSDGSVSFLDGGAANDILGDFNAKFTPPAMMMDYDSPVKPIASETFAQSSNSDFDFGELTNHANSSIMSEAVASNDPKLNDIPEKSELRTNLKTNDHKEAPLLPSDNGVFARRVDQNKETVENSSPDREELPMNKTFKMTEELSLREIYNEVTQQQQPTEELSASQKPHLQDFSVAASNSRDVSPPKKEITSSFPEPVYNKMYSHNQDFAWKSNMERKENDDLEFHSKERPEETGHGDRSHRDEEEVNSLSDHFSIDDRNRGRINIEEIRQRSYEDMELANNFSSHDRNKKEQKTTDKTPSIYVLGAASDNTCKVCGKRVYEMEKITADLQAYHKSCFRCSHCNRILSLGNFSTNDGRLYCKPHFIEIFKTKGNYNESFAAAERSKQLNDNDNRKNETAEEEEDYRGVQGRSRNSSGDNGASRTRHSSSGREEDYDESDVGGSKEKIPVVQIKSVRNMFEKMSQDQPTSTGHQSKAVKTSAQNEKKGTGKRAEQRIRSDSLKSESDREQHEFVERRDSGSEREIVQSGTTCIVEEELPPPSLTKSMLAKFKMMEDVSGSGKVTVNYGKPVSTKQTSSASAGRSGGHQTLAYRSSAGSQGSSDAASEESRSNQHGQDAEGIRSSQNPSNDEQVDELPQAGLAKSLLAQWRNLEEQSKRGRNRDLKKTSAARRSQSMSRVETVQRANVYRNVDLGSRSKQEDDGKRLRGSYSDQELSDDDSPVSMPTRQSLAKFKELEGGGQSRSETDGAQKAKRRFKWEVKEAVPLNRGGIIVHGDIPKRPTAEDAPTTRWSENLDDNDGADREPRRDESYGREETMDDVVQNTTVTVINEDELPPPATTRTLLQHFKSMEDTTKAPPLPRPAPSEAARQVRPKTRSTTSGAVYSDHDDDDTGSGDHRHHVAGSDSEDFGTANTTHDHRDTAKGSDSCDEEEMPAQGTTRNLLAKFQSLQKKH